MSEVFDLGVIGCGPGGYVAAIKAAQLGIKVICFDANELGGTCLNRGCIPSKFLLHASQLFAQRKSLEKFGLHCKGMEVDMQKMQQENAKNIAGFRTGIAGLFKKNKIKFVQKRAFIADSQTILTEDSQNFSVKKIILAMGSKVFELPNLPTDSKNIITSNEAVFLKEVPKSMAIVGGGVIGVEFASIWSRLGAKVEVIEFLEEILPGMDNEIRTSARKIFAKQGINFKLSHKALSAEIGKNKVHLQIENHQNSEKSTLEVEKVIVCVGRTPNVDEKHCQKIGLNLDKRNFIEVDENLQTSLKGVYAIGDLIHGPMLAHKAEEDGVFVAELLAGQKPHLDYNLTPAVIYTHPEIAAIGKTEQQLKEQGIAYKVGKFPFMANSRAKTVQDFEGFVKILTHKDYDTILGAHIIGPQAGTLIGQMVVAMNYGASAEDIARICHSHPDLNETIKEACLAAYFKAIHI